MKSLALAAALAAVPASAAPAMRPERIVLRTDAGDLVLALYAGTPRHAAKLLALFRDGAYDTAPVTKVDPSRFIAFAGVERRREPLPPARVRAIKRLAVETGGGPHRAGVVAMAHAPGDPDATETAFVILFADIAPMDGRFSAVGEVVGGREMLEALKSLPVDGAARPAAPLELRATVVYNSGADLGKAVLRGPDPRALGRDDSASRQRALLGLALLSLTIGAALWRLRAQLGPAAPSVVLLVGLSGFFAAFAALADLSASTPWLSVTLFASTVGVFRLMGRFER